MRDMSRAERFLHRHKEPKSTLAGAGAPINPSRLESRVLDRPPVKVGGGRNKPPIGPRTGLPPSPSGEPKKKPEKSGHPVAKAMAGVIMAGTATTGGLAGYDYLQSRDDQSTGLIPVIAPETIIPITTLGEPSTTVITSTIQPEVTTTPTTVREIIPPVTTPLTTEPEPTVATIPPPTSAETIPAMTEPAPTTTAEPQPTDVIEDKGEYKVLRNGGLLYEVESAPWFGGFQVHIKSVDGTYGFQKGEEGLETPQEVLLKNLLKTFGNQHPEFISPADGQVDINAYKTYLEERDWVDEAHFPKNLSVESDAKLPPVTKSDSLIVDFKKPFIISNDAPSEIDGFTLENGNFYKPTTADNILLAFGTTKGQLFYAYYEIGFNGVKPLLMRHPYESYPISDLLGSILTITSRITYPEKTPQDQWTNPYTYFGDLFMVNPTYVTPPYPILDVFDFVGINEQRTQGTNKLFAPIDS